MRVTSKLVAATASAALCLGTATPLLAQEFQPSGFDAPRGASATFNLRLPLDGRAELARPTFGLTVGFGRTVGGRGVDDRPAVRQFRLADVRFGGGGLSRAQLLSFDLANPSRNRLGLQGDEDSGGIDTGELILVAILAAAVGVGIEEIIDDSSEEESPETPGTGPTPG